MENYSDQEIIIGTILSENVNARKAIGILSPDMFSGPYRKMAETIWEQVQKYGDVDAILVAQETKTKPDDLARIIANAVTLRQAVGDVFDNFYKHNINKKLTKQLHETMMSLQNGGKHGEVMSQLESKYREISANNHFDDKRSEQFIDTLKDIERTMSSEHKLLGPSTGYSSFNERLGGWASSHLIYLAGRPGMGKTSLSLCLAYETAKAGASVGIITLEMAPKELRKKLLSIATGLSYSDISRGRLTDKEFQEINNAAHDISELNIHIENPVADFEQILDIMYSMKESFGIELFIIDYMQLMRKDGYKNDRNGEIGYMSRRLKESASEDRLNACIVCLSQLNRESQMGQKGKKPSLHNLRDSGSLEQDADAVIFVHRPEYYQIYEEDGEPTENLVMAIFEKNRHGETGTVKLWKSANFSQIHEQHHGFTQFPKVQTGAISKSFDGEVPF